MKDFVITSKYDGIFADGSVSCELKTKEAHFNQSGVRGGSVKEMWKCGIFFFITMAVHHIHISRRNSVKFLAVI